MRILLDSGVLGDVLNPQARSASVKANVAWAERMLERGEELFIPGIADYEVRREMFLIGSRSGLHRLDYLQTLLVYLPLDTEVMRRAAQLWSDARRGGTPTADPKEIDADVILAAQAERVGAVVATENIGHLSLFVPARH